MLNTAYAGLYLDIKTNSLFVALNAGQAAALDCDRRYQTLCAAALEACRSRKLAPLPANVRRVGHIDTARGRVVLHHGAEHDVTGAWGRSLDRYELESVALERSRDDRNRSRRAVRRGNLAEMGRLGPKRGWRY